MVSHDVLWQYNLVFGIELRMLLFSASRIGDFPRIVQHSRINIRASMYTQSASSPTQATPNSKQRRQREAFRQ